MSFTSIQFIIFFVIIYSINCVYAGICKSNKSTHMQIYKAILLLESFIFILIADWKTAISLSMLICVCYKSTEVIKKHNKFSKISLVCGLLFSIGQLCVFKYYDFVAINICKLLDLTYISSNQYLPLGISFFTFSAVAYIIDIYRKKYDSFSSIFDCALYLSFFPKLLSGPITRPDKFNAQIAVAKSKLNVENLQIGIQYAVWGFFKKMVIADHIAIFVDDVFQVPTAFNSITCIWAIISYSLQIYFDFSGYSDMAIGFSRMLGIDIGINFNIPYISKNVTEFWKRWHISLSSWLQDYVYISLGGNRKGKLRTKINLIITMLLGGLWHGAAWNFILWGGIHGVALVIHKKYMSIRKTPVEGKYSKMSKVFSVLLTFVFITITWVFFRASSIRNAMELLVQSVSMKKGIMQMYSWTWLGIFFVLGEIVYASYKKRKHNKSVLEVEYPIMELNSIKNLTLFFVLIGLTIILAYVGNTAFIYGKF